MSKEQIVAKALQDMEEATALRKRADTLDYQAKKSLADVYRGDSAPAAAMVLPKVESALTKRIARAFKN